MEILLAALLVAATFLLFFYADCSDTLDNSVMLAEAIAKGKFTEYYSYAAEHASDRTVYSANYNVFLYGIFALWNLPTVLWHAVTKFDYMRSPAALLWCKFLIVVAVLGTVYILGKIVSLYADAEVCQLVRILFVTGSCVILPTMVSSQYDILAIFVMLCGLWFYLQGRDRWFLVAFMLAVPLKLFALFAFIPLLLLREKRIPAIALKTGVIFLLDVLCALPFWNDPWYKLCIGTQNRDAINLLLNSGFKISGYNFNLFFASYAVICVLCYAQKPKQPDEDGYAQIPLYAIFGVFAAFTAFVSIRSYWVILVVPFALAVAMFNRAHRRENVLLVTLGTACYSIYACMTHWVLSADGLLHTRILRKLLGIPETAGYKYGNIANFFDACGLGRYVDVFHALFIVSLGLLLFLNLPGKNALATWKQTPSAIEWWYAPLQIAVTGVLIVAIVYANMALEPAAAIDTTASVANYMETELLADSRLEQVFQAEADVDVTRLRFIARNNSTSRSLRCMAVFTLVDLETGESLAQTSVGTALVESEELYELKLGKVHLSAGKTYALVVTADILRGDTKLYFGEAEQSEQDQMQLYLDGELQTYNLAFALQ